jgi:hypothetical protein
LDGHAVILNLSVPAQGATYSSILNLPAAIVKKKAWSDKATMEDGSNSLTFSFLPLLHRPSEAVFLLPSHAKGVTVFPLPSILTSSIFLVTPRA